MVLDTPLCYILRIHMQTPSNTNAGGVCCSGTNVLLISDFGSSTRGESIHLPRPCILDRSLIQSMCQSGLFSDWLVFKLAWSSLIRLPKAALLWQNSGSHYFSPSPWLTADDNLAVGLAVQRLYGLSFWSSYHLYSCPISRCVSHH